MILWLLAISWIFPQELLILIPSISYFSISFGAFYGLEFLGNSPFEASGIELCMSHLLSSSLFCPVLIFKCLFDYVLHSMMLNYKIWISNSLPICVSSAGKTKSCYLCHPESLQGLISVLSFSQLTQWSWTLSNLFSACCFHFNPEEVPMFFRLYLWGF